MPSTSPVRFFSSALTLFLAQHHGCQGTTDPAIQHGRGDESLRKRATQIYDDYTPKQKAQIAKRDAKHGVTAPFAVDSTL